MKFLNHMQCSESLGECALSSRTRAFAGFQVLRMENSFQIPPEALDDCQECALSVCVSSQLDIQLDTADELPLPDGYALEFIRQDTCSFSR